MEKPLRSIIPKLVRFASVCYKEDRLEGALGLYTLLLELGQTLGEKRLQALAYNNLGSVYWALGKSTEALEYYHRALRIYKSEDDLPSECLMLSRIGQVYGGLQKEKEALEFIEKALKLAPRDPRIWEAKGRILEALGRHEEAAGYYRDALLLDPEFEEAQQALKRVESEKTSFTSVPD
jgi:tetratricopeptide (TPR) repeat protein